MIASGEASRRSLNSLCRCVASALAILAIASGLGSGMAHAQSVTWDNGAGDGLWSSGTNWSANIAPLITDNVFFPTPVAGSGTVTMTGNPLANSLTFNANYLLSGTNNGTLVLGSLGAADAGRVTVATGVTGTIASSIYGNGWDRGVSGLTKSGNGTLVFGANGPTFTGGVSFGGSVSTSGVYNPFGNNPVTLNSGSWFRDAGGAYFSREMSGTGSFTKGGTIGDYAHLIQGLRDATLMVSEAPARITFGKYGPANQTITSNAVLGTRTNSGNTPVQGGQLIFSGFAGIGQAANANPYLLGSSGTLTLDNSGTLNDKYRDLDSLTFSGGEFRYVGSGTAASTELLAGFALTAQFASTINIRAGANQNATVTGSNTAAATVWSRGLGSALNVKYTNNGTGVAALVFGTNAPALTNGIIGGVFVNGADFATHGGVAPATIAALTNYATPSGGNMGGVTSTSNVLVDAASGDQTLGATATLNALKIDGAQTVALGANALDGGSSTLPFMILKTSAGSAAITGGASGLLRNVGAATQDYVVRVDAGDLTISAAPELAGSAAFVKSGTGLLILNPSGTWGSGTAARQDSIVVQEGAIRLDAGSTRFGNMGRRFAGGVFELTGNWTATVGTSESNVNWLATSADGGFAAFGGTRTVTLSSTLAWNASNSVANGKALLLNSETADSKIVMANGISLAGAAAELWFREFRVADNPNSSSDFAEITGVISGTINQSHFLKTGAGRLDIGGASSHTYLGETMVRTGTLNINGVLGAVSGAGSHGLVTAMSTGGILGGSGTISRPVFIEAGGFLAPGSSGIGTLALNTAAGNARIRGTLAVEVSGNGSGLTDFLDVTSGTLDISGATVNFSVLETLNDAAYVFAKYGTLTGGTFSSVVGAPAPYTVDYNYQNLNQIALVVPEPSAIMMTVVGLSAFAARRLRRRK